MAPRSRTWVLMVCVSTACVGVSSSDDGDEETQPLVDDDDDEPGEEDDDTPEGGRGGDGGSGGGGAPGNGGRGGGTAGAGGSGGVMVVDGGGGGTASPDAGAPEVRPAIPDAMPPPEGSTPTFAAAGYSGVRTVSRDLGQTWVDRQTSGGGGDDPNLLRGIGCGAGLCIAGGGSAGASGWLSITADGKTWRRVALGQPGLSDIAFGNGIWVGVSGHYAIRSADAVMWEVGSDKNALSFGGILRRMTFAGGKFIAWGDGGKRVASTDGRSWTRITSGHD